MIDIKEPLLVRFFKVEKARRRRQRERWKIDDARKELVGNLIMGLTPISGNPDCCEVS